jgi:GNAT superfamily N-acetyltransferase
MSDYEIRPARPDDWPTIVEFNRQLAEETEGLRLDPVALQRGVRAALNDPAKARYYVADAGSLLLGQLMHTWEWSDWRNGQFWWLQSVYVRPDARGRGVFRRLFEHVHDLARNAPEVVGIRLYVEHGNQRAHDVYRRLGLKPSGYEVLEECWLRESSRVTP